MTYFDLDLIVNPPEDLELAVFSPTTDVARVEHHAAGRPSEPLRSLFDGEHSPIIRKWVYLVSFFGHFG
jgi:hypothetical protein